MKGKDHNLFFTFSMKSSGAFIKKMNGRNISAEKCKNEDKNIIRVANNIKGLTLNL